MTGRHSSSPASSGAGSPGHGHSHGPAPDLRIAALPRRVLLAFLAVTLLGSVVGLVMLFPDDEAAPRAQYAAPGVSFPQAEVLAVQRRCPGAGDPDSCARLRVRVLDGAATGTRPTVTIPPDVAESGLRAGDTVELVRIPAANGAPTSYTFFGVDRSAKLGWMALLFVVVVAAVARWKGLLAVLGLVIAGVVLIEFMLPALLAGSSGLGVALVGSTLIMFAVLYLAHGLSLRTSTALAGTLIGVGVTAGLAAFAVAATRLSGVGDDATGLLTSQAGDLNFQGLLTCGMILAALGVLNDVTITQSSAVWELRAVAPDLNRRELYARGMRIGRDHIASTIYTIVFAYAGAALAVLLLLDIYQRPLLDLLGTESIAQEVVRTLAGAIGLVLAVPLTTAIAALVVGDAQPERAGQR